MYVNTTGTTFSTRWINTYRSNIPAGLHGRRAGRLAFTRYCFTSRLYCGSQSSFHCPPPTCKAHSIEIRLHDHCAIYAPPTDPSFVCHTPYNIGDGQYRVKANRQSGRGRLAGPWDVPLDLCSLHVGSTHTVPLFPQASTGAGPAEWAGTLRSSGAVGFTTGFFYFYFTGSLFSTLWITTSRSPVPAGLHRRRAVRVGGHARVERCGGRAVRAAARRAERRRKSGRAELVRAHAEGDGGRGRASDGARAAALPLRL